MKRIGLLLILLLVALPAAAQSDALLLYTVWEDGAQTVRALNVDTGEETTIAGLLDELGNSWGDVGWSPDGRYVWVVDTPNQTHRRLRLFEAGTWSERVITDNLFLDGCFPAIFWSPDGQHLSYITGAEPDFPLMLLNLATDATYTIDHLGNPQGPRPVFSPDGRYLVTAGGKLVDTSDGSVVMEFDGINGEFSPDSRFLTYLDRTLGRWLYDLTGGELIDLATSASLMGWSPDGRYLLLRHEDEQARASFHVYEQQTRLFQPLDVGERIWGIEGWLSGGADVLLMTYSNDNGSGQTLLRYTLATGDFAPILETPGFVMRVVTDGSWLVVTYRLGDERGYAPSNRLWLSDGETVLDEELIIHGAVYTTAQEVAWSPDGRWLMLLADDGIHRFDPQTAALERLPLDAQRFEVPMWSADSRYLVFHAYPNQGSERRETMLWNTVEDTIAPLPHPVGTIIGWQNGEAQDSLLYCGIGG